MMIEEIKALEKRSKRELEILSASPKGQIAPQFLREFRSLEMQREAARNDLIKQGWAALQKLGYQKYDYRGNAAYESGHSDVKGGYGTEGFYVFWGVKAPDGTDFPGTVSWTDGIVPAIEHAKI